MIRGSIATYYEVNQFLKTSAIKALFQQWNWGESFFELLGRRIPSSKMPLLSHMASQLGIEERDITVQDLDWALIQRFSFSFLKDRCCLPISLDESGLVLGVSTPFMGQILEEVSWVLPVPITVFMLSQIQIESCLDQFSSYGTGVSSEFSQGFLSCRDHVDAVKLWSLLAPSKGVFRILGVSEEIDLMGVLMCLETVSIQEDSFCYFGSFDSLRYAGKELSFLPSGYQSLVLPVRHLDVLSDVKDFCSDRSVLVGVYASHFYQLLLSLCECSWRHHMQLDELVQVVYLQRFKGVCRHCCQVVDRDTLLKVDDQLATWLLSQGELNGHVFYQNRGCVKCRSNSPVVECVYTWDIYPRTLARFQEVGGQRVLDEAMCQQLPIILEQVLMGLKRSEIDVMDVMTRLRCFSGLLR